jgi:hypothetical protein
MANLYLLLRTDGSSEDITADFYERQGDDWVFFLSGEEVGRVKIDEVSTVGKAPRDMA